MAASDARSAAPPLRRALVTVLVCVWGARLTYNWARGFPGFHHGENPAAGRIMDRGLWAYCRHPNYLGEIGFWWGLYVCGLSADAGAPWGGAVGAWTAVGPLWISALFVFISVPLIDQRSLARRPGYREHMARVPALLPRLRRRG